MEVNGCIGCNACRYGKACVQKDDFNDLVPKIKKIEFDCIRFTIAVLDTIIQNKSIH